VAHKAVTLIDKIIMAKNPKLKLFTEMAGFECQEN